MENNPNNKHCPSLPLVLFYPGSCIMFNLKKCIRAKKRATCNNDINSDSWEEDAKKIGDLWEDDEDLHLIVRIIHNDYPWTVAHYGTKEVFKAPLVIPIRNCDVQGENISIFFRDFANRGDNCITRKFSLHFASAAEAESFQFVHNMMLTAGNKKKKETANKEEENKENKDNKKEENKENKKEDGFELPPRKKRKLSSIISKEDQKKEEEKQEEKQGEKSGYKAIVNDFMAGDEHNLLDDCFPETQNAYDDEESI
jgi:hypothetical protein